MMQIKVPWPDGTNDAEALRVRHRLTRSEWQLVTELCRGTDLRHAAEAARVTYQTARSTLKQVFAKTQTHRQAELVALLMRERR